MSNKVKALLAVLAIVVFSGGTAPYVKLSLKRIPPITFIFIRFFLSFVLILPLFLVRVRPKFKLKDFKLILLSLLQTGNIILFAYGIKMTKASVGQIIYAFTPILVVLISFFSLKEKMSLKKVLGVVIGFIGVNIIVGMPIFSKSVDINYHSNPFFGNMLILIGCIGYSYYSVLSKKFLKEYSPMWLTVSFIFSTAAVSLFLIPLEYSYLRPIMSYFNQAVLWPIFYVIVIGTVMAYLLQQYAIDRGTPLIASLMQYFFPASTLIWSYFILGERLDFFLGVGLVLILSGAWLVTRES